MNSNKQLVVFGEIMMRLQTHGHERFVQAREFDAYYTGAETNVAVSVANYGLRGYVVSKIPATEIGQACINYVRSFGVNTDFVVRGGKRLGLFYLETGASQRPSNIIYDRAGSAVTELCVGEIDWEAVFDGKDWFHFTGITPALAPNLVDVTAEACRSAKRLGLTVSCDLNYRSKLWGRDEAQRAMTGLMEFVDVLICNEEDAEMVFGIRARDSEVARGQLGMPGYQEVAAELQRRFSLRHVAITLRESLSATLNGWSGLLYDGQSFYRSRRYEMWVVDRVGGGDAFAGGLVYALLTATPPQDALEFAVAASCLKHSIPGDFNLVTAAEVKALMRGDQSGRVRR